MIAFTKYAKIKDFYCLCYYGNSDEYLLQLALIKPLIENRFPGVQVYIGCKDEKKQLFLNDDFVLKRSTLIDRSNFGYIREIKFNGKTHPIQELMDECEIKNLVICEKLQQEYNNKCVIITKANYPTISLDQNKITILKRIAQQDGFEYCLDEDVRDAGLVIGVESWGLFEAASKGIRTKLYPTGVGADLYKSLFPRGEIIKI
jgi:hypothetical protein